MMTIYDRCEWVNVFFWYRLTPDKIHRAVKRLCVFVCYAYPQAALEAIGWGPFPSPPPVTSPILDIFSRDVVVIWTCGIAEGGRRWSAFDVGRWFGVSSLRGATTEHLSAGVLCTSARPPVLPWTSSTDVSSSVRCCGADDQVPASSSPSRRRVDVGDRWSTAAHHPLSPAVNSHHPVNKAEYSSWQTASLLQELTCHMGSHSATCQLEYLRPPRPLASLFV